MSKRISDVSLSGARIFWRNFSGVEMKFNPPGKRNFAVELPEELANKMLEDGWNVKYQDPREEGDPGSYYISVAVGFGNYPPQIWLVNSIGKTRLNEETVNLLDWAELENVDLILRAYPYEINGRQGIKAYLKAGYFTVLENEFEDRYRELPIK